MEAALEETYEENHIIQSDLPCEDCGSSDAKATYSDGHTYCFSCETRQGAAQGSGEQPVQATGQAIKIQEGLIEGHVPTEGIPKRLVSSQTCRKFDYRFGTYRGQPVHIANIRDVKGTVVAQSLRTASKGFQWLGEHKKGTLFGQHLWNKGRRLVVTEGALDCMAFSSYQDDKWPVVSVTDGAGNAAKQLQAQLEYLQQFEEVILMFDNDEAGTIGVQKAAEALAPHHKCIKIAHLELKDPCDMLQAGKGKQLMQAMWDAKEYRPDGVLDMAELADVITDPARKKDSLPYPWEGLNKITRGARQGELVTLCAGTGIGKSAVCGEIAYHLYRDHKETVGVMMLEESAALTQDRLLGIHMNKRVTIDREDISDEELLKAHAGLFPKQGEVGAVPRMYLYDHFGSTDVDKLLGKIRYMVVTLGCRWIILDHLSIVVSGLAVADERKSIDIAMTKLRSLCEETGCGMFLVSHLKRPSSDKGFEEGLEINLNHLRGSQAISQLSDMVLGLQRNKKDDSLRNYTEVVVLKNRFTGEDGCTGCWLKFDADTGRLAEVEEPKGDDNFEGEEMINDF